MGKPPDYDVSKFRKCGKHGIQNINEFYPFKSKSRHGKEIIVYRCKLCIRGRRVDAYHADPKANNAATNAWRRANPEAAKAIVTRCYEKNKDKYLPRAVERRLERRLLVLSHYAGGDPKCCLCEEKHHEFLALDHIDGGGTKHHEELGDKHRGEKFYKWIIKQNFPSGYRVLCHNCNFKYGIKSQSHKILNPSKYPDSYLFRHPEKHEQFKSTKRDAYQALKMSCLLHYGGEILQCTCCGLKDKDTLSIDHINGGGRKHREEIKTNGNQFYRWLVLNDFPLGYRVLCLNCNFSYGLYKHCPHQGVHNAS